jgi:hypothetical protein
VDACGISPAGDDLSVRQVASASNDGQARFCVPRDADYSIEVKATGFKTVRIKKAHFGSGSSLFPTAYVQVQLHIAGPMVTVW